MGVSTASRHSLNQWRPGMKWRSDGARISWQWRRWRSSARHRNRVGREANDGALAASASCGRNDVKRIGIGVACIATALSRLSCLARISWRVIQRMKLAVNYFQFKIKYCQGCRLTQPLIYSVGEAWRELSRSLKLAKTNGER
jgi:hypothetical protein